MEPLTLQLQRGDDESVECWDDDGELQCGDDFQFPTVSRATSVTNSSVRRSGRRDSISSRRSARSDLDSNVGGDEDWEVGLHENDELVNQEAIASAKNAGIPLPANVPKSALVGGTIKRLGGKKPKKDFLHDWAEDLELPNSEDALELKSPPESTYPEFLRQVGSTAASPVKSRSPFQDENDDTSPRLQSALTKLSEFRDESEIVDLQDVPTIKVAKTRSPQKTTSASDSNQRAEPEVESFDQDFELPADSSPLKLPSRKANRKTPSPTPEDFDVDWCEGSIGVRFGGTTRDRRSNPSSSISVVSPSVSSCLSAGSDDDGLDGLVLPDGPLSLDKALKKPEDPQSTSSSEQPAKLQPDQDSDNLDDFFSGIEIQEGNVFTSKKLSLNPNVECKRERPWSPARRSATTVTFTDSTGSPKTRIPRPPGHAHSYSTHLETVSESGAPPSQLRALQPHVGDHSSSSSISGVVCSGPTSIPARLTLNRRLIGTRTAQETTDDLAGHAGRPLLKSKRSMPAMRNSHQTSSTELAQSSLSRREGMGGSLATPTVRSFTPADRIGNGTRPLNRRPPGTFIPVGSSGDQSNPAAIKIHGHSYSKSSDRPGDMPSSYGPVSRASRLHRNGFFGTSANGTSPEAVLTATKQPLARPTRRRNFGDGTELESFDDLPTSSFTESRFIKNPAGRGAPRSLRTRLSGSQNSQHREASNQPQTPVTLSKPPDSTPRFARDTNASRNAREQRIASMNTTLKGREGTHLPSINANWKAPTPSRVPSSPTLTRKRKTKPSGLPGTKPHLIKPMGAGVQEAKSVNGMHYNPATFCWEGNEKSVQDFDTAPPKSPKHAPALITNVGKMQNARVVGGMVFDPQSMSWRKLAPLQPGSNGQVAVQDEDDVFAGLDDLEEKTPGSAAPGVISDAFDDHVLASGDDRSGESSDELPITEEFDVGPEFIRRQRAEEEKWRRKIDKWTNAERAKLGNGWRWAIRDLVKFNGVAGSPP